LKSLETRSADNTRIHLSRWGEENVRNVLLVHGLAEHVGRYGHVAERLVRAGFRVTFVELRGHGASEGRRGHVERWRRYTEDLRAAAATIGQPFALVAHSMGGLVSLDAVLEPIAPPLLGLALSNPLVRPAIVAPPMKIKAARVLSRIFPWLPLKNEIDTSLISRDKAVVRAYEADPLVYGTISPRWGMEMLAASERVQANPGRCTVPLRMMVSDADQICDHKASVAVAERWGGPHELVIYRGLYHELFNEPEQAQVFDGLCQWLNTLAWPA
jgi:alpha-beta hydrolase superfamily lysophospholipase